MKFEVVPENIRGKKYPETFATFRSGYTIADLSRISEKYIFNCPRFPFGLYNKINQRRAFSIAIDCFPTIDKNGAERKSWK